jgi:hypothetical protein
MLAASGYRHKKDLKAAVGQPLGHHETSIVGREYRPTGTFCVVGPSAYERRWYARVTMKDGVIERVE